MNMKQPGTLDELGELLIQDGIDISLYGKGKAKDLEDLLQEILEGDSYLELDEETKKVKRVVQVVNARILYEKPKGGILELFEEKQEFKDSQGTVTRTRNRKLPASVMEKFSIGEEPADAIIRGVKEELNIVLHDYQYIDARESYKEISDLSPSFPGLPSTYKTHSFDILLEENQYNPDGYIERQKKKDTFFPWREWSGNT